MNWKFRVIQSNLYKIQPFFWIILIHFFRDFFELLCRLSNNAAKMLHIQINFQKKFEDIFPSGIPLHFLEISTMIYTINQE